jgi:hypothetical protein
MASLSSYIELITAFTARSLSAADFESRYLDMFKSDGEQHPAPVFAVLDELFAGVDAFCVDPELRGDDDLDEEQLRERSEVALRKLRNLQS